MQEAFDDGVFIKYAEEERRSRRPVAAATRSGRHDILRIAASLVVDDATIASPSSSLLALLASRGVAATMVIRIGS
jgi:hypothetical protein